MEKDFSVPVPQRLLDFEERTKRNVERPILERLARARAGLYKLENEETL